MKIKEIIWLKEFADKMEWKHGVTADEVDEVLDKQPPVRKMARGSRQGEDLYRAIEQTNAGRYLSIFFIYKGRERALVISARDANAKELKSYARQKKQNKRTS